LIFKFYNPESGSILIDDKDIYKYSANSLYNNLTYVPQETILLHSTIYDNIKIAKPDATKEEIYNAAKKAELHNFIESLEDKYNTIVGDGGVQLSGGETQRVAIARAIAKNTEVLLMDEATSGLDDESEHSVVDALKGASDNQTIIVVTHRLKTALKADCVFFFKDGEILSSGTHKQLLDSCPEYKKIYSK